MIRYNAAHRGAETEVFPATDAAGLPVIAYAGLRMGRLAAADARRPARLHAAAGADVVSLRAAKSGRHGRPGGAHDRRELDEALTC